jgi:transcriptional regulator with XRE-family HTH domain
MPSKTKLTLMNLFQKRQYRRAYVESFFNTRLAAQIKLLREARGYSQEQLAGALNTQQSAISKLENGSYSNWTVKTLRRVARAFDVALQVRFISFGEVLADIDEFSKTTLLKPSFHDDPVFHSLSETIVLTGKGQTFASTPGAVLLGTPIGFPVQQTLDLGSGWQLHKDSRLSVSGSIALTTGIRMTSEMTGWQGSVAEQPPIAANDNLALAS